MCCARYSGEGEETRRAKVEQLSGDGSGEMVEVADKEKLASSRGSYGSRDDVSRRCATFVSQWSAIEDGCQPLPLSATLVLDEVSTSRRRSKSFETRRVGTARSRAT